MNTFKNLFLLLVAATAMNVVNAQNSFDDDIYYSPEKDGSPNFPVPQPQKQQPAAISGQNTPAAEIEPVQQDTNGQGNMALSSVQNNSSGSSQSYYDDSFNYDDYYDYQYASRIRRFHHGCGNYGYYDNYYTNSYWYNNDPYYWGSSIYLGYSWWGPSYYAYAFSPGLICGYGAGINWGWRWYDPWFSYSYSWGYPSYGYGNGYWNGYHNGYWNGYYNGYNNGYYNATACSNNYYFNSYDKNSYYGSRNGYYGSRGSSTNGTNGAHQILPKKSFGDKFMEAKAIETSRQITPVISQNNTGFTSQPVQPVTTGPVKGNGNTGFSSGLTGGNGKPVTSTQEPVKTNSTNSGFTNGTSAGGNNGYTNPSLNSSTPVVGVKTTTGTNAPVTTTATSAPDMDKSKFNNTAGASKSGQASTHVTSAPQPKKDNLYDDYYPVVKPAEVVAPVKPTPKYENRNSNYQSRANTNSSNTTTTAPAPKQENRSGWGNGGNNSSNRNSGGSYSGGNTGGRSGGGTVGGSSGGGRSGGAVGGGGGGRAGGSSGGRTTGGRR